MRTMEGAPQTIVARVRALADHRPDDTAYAQLADGPVIAERMTYGQLDRQAGVIAGFLRQKGLAGEPVLLLLPSSLRFIAALFGCFYAASIAVPLFPPRPNRSLHRIKTIASDCDAKYVLSDAVTLERVTKMFSSEPWLQRLEWVAVESVLELPAAPFEADNVTADHTAFLQYTSGSTAEPKGVVVRHRHLILNARKIWEPLAVCENSIVVGWLPMFHDLGLIGYVISSLYGGVPYYFMAPEAFLTRPMRWLEAVSTYRACISGAPTFAYDLCVRRAKPDTIRTFDLSCWNIAFCGAETINSSVLRDFSELYAQAGFDPGAFYPSYGLAEATLFVTGGVPGRGLITKRVDAEALKEGHVVPVSEDHGSRLIAGCGRLWSDSHELNIVDPETRRKCAPDRVGEIWIRGEGVAAGYWKQPAETQYAFSAHLADPADGPYLRTGDLGFIEEDELYVVARIKEMIIIGGMNHYPGDIENTVASIDARLRQGGCAAFSMQEEKAETLAIVVEIDRKLAGLGPDSSDLKELIHQIERGVWDAHDVIAGYIALVRPVALPRTTSGKIQRLRCRDMLEAGDLQTIAVKTRAKKAPPGIKMHNDI